MPYDDNVVNVMLFRLFIIYGML